MAQSVSSELGKGDLQVVYTSAPFGACSPYMRSIGVNFFVFVSEQWLLVSLLLALIYLLVFSEHIKSGKQLSVHDLTRLVNQDAAVVIDVRDVKDYQDGHIAGAFNIPLAKLDERLVELDKYKAKPVIIVDKMGQQSGAAGKKLRAAGFEVRRLRGGMGEWRSQSLPVVAK